ncbi:hypothetical protein GDO81_028414 [Engystomops pustulosus]|uniref:Uncharacterized protein n=1 Tax=Engystomops pustulosus TaxID=76066 RepID=A0AAV6YJX0_ENGPU|nr:hypothetical protein GDO81_028414 [Engystomops pustulosus]
MSGAITPIIPSMMSIEYIGNHSGLFDIVALEDCPLPLVITAFESVSAPST